MTHVNHFELPCWKNTMCTVVNTVVWVLQYCMKSGHDWECTLTKTQKLKVSDDPVWVVKVQLSVDTSSDSCSLQWTHEYIKPKEAVHKAAHHNECSVGKSLNYRDSRDIQRRAVLIKSYFTLTFSSKLQFIIPYFTEQRLSHPVHSFVCLWPEYPTKNLLTGK